jgi:hypothetical protein
MLKKLKKSRRLKPNHVARKAAKIRKILLKLERTAETSQKANKVNKVVRFGPEPPGWPENYYRNRK